MFQPPSSFARRRFAALAFAFAAAGTVAAPAAAQNFPTHPLRMVVAVRALRRFAARRVR